jgi:protein-export membrane protein SecD
MNRSWWYRASLLLVLSIFAIFAIIPTLMNFDEEKSNFPVKSKINLGLDLQGGLYMVLGIDFKKVYKDEIQNFIKKAENLLKDEGIGATIGESILTDLSDPKYTITIDNEADLEQAKSKIKEFYNQEIRVANTDGTTLTYGIAKAFKTNVEENAVKKSIEVIRNRIDEFGVTEPEIVSLGKDRVVVQLPGVKDIERAKALIGKTAKLSFRIVNEDVAGGTLQEWMTKSEEAGITHKRGQRFSDYVSKMNAMFKKDIPKGNELVFKKVLSVGSSEIDQLIPYVVESIANVTGDDLQDATVRIDQENNQPYVGMTFNSTGAKRFEDVTGENIGRRLAIILDGNVYSDPVVQARIGGGNAQVTLGAGNYDTQLKEARDLSLVLRAGALPVELEFQEQRVVGPSLGADSIEKSKNAGLVGAFLVFLFILFYYKFSGVLAIKTLLLNILFMLACLVGLEATLTLPGIAGIALTVGMAVDANIIIFERIKEELAMGTPIREAVQTGFSRAFWTILDANLTTAVAGLMLLNFGTGPIRGFAVTLIIGIMCTIYTAYFVSKLFFEFYMTKNNAKKLSI